jgi:hypothetical protein
VVLPYQVSKLLQKIQLLDQALLNIAMHCHANAMMIALIRKGRYLWVV